MNLENTLGMLQWLDENIQQAEEAIESLSVKILCFDYPDDKRLQDVIRLSGLNRELETMQGMHAQLVDYLHTNYRMSWDC